MEKERFSLLVKKEKERFTSSCTGKLIKVPFLRPLKFRGHSFLYTPIWRVSQEIMGEWVLKEEQVEGTGGMRNAVTVSLGVIVLYSYSILGGLKSSSPCTPHYRVVTLVG